MRISAIFSMDQDSIDKDKNRIFISILKSILESYDLNVYKKIFERGPTRKSYCFALYMKDAEFTRDKIIIPNKKIVFKLSTAELEDAIHISVSYTHLNGAPIHVELGCGKGRFLRENAVNNPHINYFGFEKSIKVAYRCAKATFEKDPPNYFIVLASGDILKEVFEEGSIDRIYLNFPDPWPKAVSYTHLDVYKRQAVVTIEYPKEYFEEVVSIKRIK